MSEFFKTLSWTVVTYHLSNPLYLVKITQTEGGFEKSINNLHAKANGRSELFCVNSPSKLFRLSKNQPAPHGRIGGPHAQGRGFAKGEWRLW